MGYAAALEDGMKVVDLFETEPTWDALERERRGTADGYRIVHVARPRARGAASTATARSTRRSSTRPRSARSSIEPEVWDAKRVQEREARNAAHRPARLSARRARAGRHAGRDDRGDGQRAAPARLPERHAGRAGAPRAPARPGDQGRQPPAGCATACPDVRILLTGNADVNAPMNAVNDALGYREIERCVEMQKDV